MSNSFFNWPASLNRFVRFTTARAEAVNSALDQVSAGFDQIEEKIGGNQDTSIRVPSGESIPTLPSAANRANKILVFDPEGKPTVEIPSDQSAIGLAIRLFSYLGASFVGWIQSGMFAIRRTVEDRLRDRISVADFGALPNGVICTAAVVAADAAAAAAGKQLYWPGAADPSAYYAFDATVVRLSSWIGEFCGRPYLTPCPVRIIKVNGTTNGNTVSRPGAKNLRVDCISALAKNVPAYYFANYPNYAPYRIEDGNCEYGFGSAGGFEGQEYNNCSGDGFTRSGFQNLFGDILSKHNGCNGAYNGNYGFDLGSTDCEIENCISHHNSGTGIIMAGPYIRAVNNRCEWNARYGIWNTGGEFTILGNLLDRNGMAGVFLDGGWGGTVTANYFSRNGALGNGSFGRWGFATPGNPAYEAIATADSCHIKYRNVRGVVVSANRYRSGGSDSGDGASAPGQIYFNAGGNGTIQIKNNASEYANTGGDGGYDPAYPSSAGVWFGDPIYRRETGYQTTATGSFAFGFDGTDSFGEITLKYAQGTTKGVCKITYSYDTVFGGLYGVQDLIGTSAPGLGVFVGGSGIVVSGYTNMSGYQRSKT